MAKNRVALISQALQAAMSSINLARQMLTELEKEVHVSAKDLPGISGIFDGEGMTGEDDKKYQVPENYASKSMLVNGDTLKMVEEGGETLFKQISRVKRLKETGILAKKEGRWHAVTASGSYRLLPAAVSYNRGVEGEEVVIVLPQDKPHSAYAALESVKKETPSVVNEEPVSIAKKAPATREVRVASPAAKPAQKQLQKPPQQPKRKVRAKKNEEVRAEPVRALKPEVSPVAETVTADAHELH